MFIKTICHAEQEWRNGSIKSCHTQPGEMTLGMNGSRPQAPTWLLLDLGPIGTSHPESWPGRGRPLPQNPRAGQHTAGGFSVPLTAFQIGVNSRQPWERPGPELLLGICRRARRATLGAPLAGRNRAKLMKATLGESAEAQHKRSWRKFNKSCFIFSGGPYWLLSNLFHPQSLFFGKAEKREGGWA